MSSNILQSTLLGIRYIFSRGHTIFTLGSNFLNSRVRLPYRVSYYNDLILIILKRCGVGGIFKPPELATASLACLDIFSKRLESL